MSTAHERPKGIANATRERIAISEEVAHEQNTARNEHERERVEVPCYVNACWIHTSPLCAHECAASR